MLTMLAVQVAWHDNRMKTMRDFLMWYNNRYVVPFLDAIDKQFAFYKQQNIDMFKDGVSVPVSRFARVSGLRV